MFGNLKKNTIYVYFFKVGCVVDVEILTYVLESELNSNDLKFCQMIHNWRGLHTLKQSNSWAIHIISPQGNNILAITNYWSSSMSGMALELIWWSVPIQSLKTLVPAVSCTFLRGNWVHWFLNCFPEQLFKQWLSTGEVAELGLLLSLRANCEVMRLLEEVNFTLRFHDMRYTSDYILLQLLVYFPIKSPNKLGFRWRGFLFNGEVETI